MNYEIYVRKYFVKIEIEQYFRGASREDCIAQIEASMEQSLAESYEIISEGPING